MSSARENVYSMGTIPYTLFKVLFSDGETWPGNWGDDGSDPCSQNMAMPTSPKLQKRGFVGVFRKCGSSEQIAVWAACEIAELGLKSARVLCEIFPRTANKCCITGVNIVVKIGKAQIENWIQRNPTHGFVRFSKLFSFANSKSQIYVFNFEKACLHFFFKPTPTWQDLRDWTLGRLLNFSPSPSCLKPYRG